MEAFEEGFGLGMVLDLACKVKWMPCIDFGYTSLRISIQRPKRRHKKVRNFVLPIRRNITTHNHELRRTELP